MESLSKMVLFRNYFIILGLVPGFGLVLAAANLNLSYSERTNLVVDPHITMETRNLFVNLSDGIWKLRRGFYHD